MKPAVTHTRMTRLTVDVPASLPLIELYRLAERHQCRIVRRADGSLLFRPNERRPAVPALSTTDSRSAQDRVPILPGKPQAPTTRKPSCP